MNKSLILFFTMGILSFVIGMTWPISGQTKGLIYYLGYFSIATCTGLFAVSLRVIVKEEVFPLVQNWRNYTTPVLAILATVFWVLSIEPFMFKIIFDELLISSNGQMMHELRIPAIATKANWSTGEYQFAEYFLGKRPLLMPFLISLLHDVSGYRMGNVFILNAALVFLFLSISFGLVSRIADRKSGYMFLVLFGFLPLFAQGATSGNASILNLTLLAGSLYLARRYMDEPSSGNLVPLVYSLILISQARYESVIYIIGLGLLILLGWQKAGKVILSPSVVIAPIFLVLVLIQHRYSMTFGNLYWQDGPGERADIFSMGYVLPNLRSTIEFLFNIGRGHPNSMILSVIGVTGMFVVIQQLVSNRQNLKDRILISVFIILLLSNLAVLLPFNFGTFTVFATSRLSLPLHLFLALFAAVAFYKSPRWLILGSIGLFSLVFAINTSDYSKSEWIESGWAHALTAVIVVATGVFLLKKLQINKPAVLVSLFCISVFATSPKLHTRPYFLHYQPAQVAQHLMEFTKANRGKDVLFLSDMQYISILLRQNGMSPKDFLKNKNQVEKAITTGHYKNIYLLYTESEYLEYELNLDIEEYRSLLPEFTLTQVEKVRIYPDLFMTVQRIDLPQ